MVEQTVCPEIGSLHIYSDTKWRNFLQMWDFQYFNKNKKRHFCHFLAQSWGYVMADYEGHCHIYHLPEKKLVSID